MRNLVVLLATLVAFSASADEFLTGDALQEDVKRCADGCLVLSREEAAQLQYRIAMMVAAVEAEAKKRGELSCRNAVVYKEGT